MEKDKLPEWLKGQATRFELTPSQGSFDVMMRRREVQRKQRRLFMWIGMAAVMSAVMGAGIWFATSSSVLTPEAEQMTHATIVTPHAQSDKYTEANEKESQITQPEPVRESPVVSDIPAPVVSTKTLPVQTDPAVRAVHPASQSTLQKEIQHKEPSATYTATPSYKTAPAITTAPEVTPMPKDGIAAVVQSDSVSINMLQDSTLTQVPKDSAMQTASVPPAETGVVKPADKESYWAIAGVFTPQLMNSVYNANSDATLSWMKKYLENREQNDKALYSFNAGIKVERVLSKHWSVSAGLLYSMVKFEEIKLLNTVVTDTSKFVSLAEADKAKKVVQVDQTRFDISFSSLEVPMQVGYRLQRKKMYYQLTAGMSYAYLFQTRSLVFDQKDSLNVHETDDAGNNRLTRHSLLVLGGINVGYEFSKRLSCYAGPVYRYSLNSIYSKDYIIRQQPYYLGLEMGIKYYFR
ncbi:MAG: outer membrane beta-barrel protein [Bacteroidota bacterium]